MHRSAHAGPKLFQGQEVGVLVDIHKSLSSTKATRITEEAEIFPVAPELRCHRIFMQSKPSLGR